VFVKAPRSVLKVASDVSERGLRSSLLVVVVVECKEVLMEGCCDATKDILQRQGNMEEV